MTVSHWRASRGYIQERWLALTVFSLDCEDGLLCLLRRVENRERGEYPREKDHREPRDTGTSTWGRTAAERCCCCAAHCTALHHTTTVWVDDVAVLEGRPRDGELEGRDHSDRTSHRPGRRAGGA